jgi:hypothetical protein
MTSKNDPPRALLHGADDPLRDDDIYATASDTDVWRALKLRSVLAEIQRRRRLAREAGEFGRSHQWERTAETLGVAIAEMENNQMPWPLREQAHKLALVMHDDFRAEWGDLSARERDEDSAAEIARHEASLDADAPLPFGWDDETGK